MRRTRAVIGFGWLTCVAALLCASALGGCGLLGVSLTPESTTTTVQFYTIPIACESDVAGRLVLSTSTILYNPEANSAAFYRRGVLVVSETDPAPPPVEWSPFVLDPGYAVRLDCDSFVRLVTNDPTATFNNQYEAGTRLDGILTVGIESDSTVSRLDVLVERAQRDGTSATELIAPSIVSVTDWPPETGAN